MSATQFSGAEALTVGSTSVGFSSSNYGQSSFAHLTVEVSDVRMTLNGGDATVAAGIPLRPNDEVILESLDEIKRVRFIRDSGTDATVIAHFGSKA